MHWILQNNENNIYYSLVVEKIMLYQNTDMIELIANLQYKCCMMQHHKLSKCFHVNFPYSILKALMRIPTVGVSLWLATAL